MINLLLSETNRSYYYVKELLRKKIEINKILLYTNKLGPTYNIIKKNRLEKKLIICKNKNINSEIIFKKAKFNKEQTNIISTYPGEIIKNKNLLNLKLLHCHPGNLPEFKGSTTIYYSLILKKNIYVTIFFMKKEIDNGKIVFKKRFNKPKKIATIEKNFDSKIRALTLAQYLSKISSKKYKVKKKRYLKYYIAHPIIRQLVLNKDYLR